MIITKNNEVKEVKYNEFSKEFEVTFKNNMSCKYKDVPNNVVNNIQIAESLTKFYEDNIERQYEVINVSQADILLKS